MWQGANLIEVVGYEPVRRGQAERFGHHELVNPIKEGERHRHPVLHSVEIEV